MKPWQRGVIASAIIPDNTREGGTTRTSFLPDLPDGLCFRCVTGAPTSEEARTFRIDLWERTKREGVLQRLQ